MLYDFTVQGRYTDQDELGEILGWYLQARFGDAHATSALAIVESTIHSSRKGSLQALHNTHQSQQLFARLLDADQHMTVASRKQAVYHHVHHVMGLPESVPVPIEALEYWHKYRGTSRGTALSLFIAGVHRKAHDSNDEW